MINTAALVSLLEKMGHSKVHQYVLPGLTSSLIGGRQFGKVRLLSADRATKEWVTPHSHRFDFVCLVLSGQVENILFVPGAGDQYAKGIVRPDPHNSAFGAYLVQRTEEVDCYNEVSTIYRPGDMYSMSADEIHSIRFSAGAQVLFFEGPTTRSGSVILEPYSKGKTVRTFEVPEWMFEREPT